MILKKNYGICLTVKNWGTKNLSDCRQVRIKESNKKWHYFDPSHKSIIRPCFFNPTFSFPQQGIVHTEKLVYGDPDQMVQEKLLTTNVPVVETETQKVVLENEDGTYSATGEIVSSQTISSKTRTVETITVSPETSPSTNALTWWTFSPALSPQYKTERDGVVETRVEQKITIQSDGDPIDHDRALAEAIQEATAMNPDMTVEKIEIQQQQTNQWGVVVCHRLSALLLCCEFFFFVCCKISFFNLLWLSCFLFWDFYARAANMAFFFRG